MRGRAVPSAAVLGPPARRPAKPDLGFPREVFDGGGSDDRDAAVSIGNAVPRHLQRDITVLAHRVRAQRHAEEQEQQDYEPGSYAVRERVGPARAEHAPRMVHRGTRPAGPFMVTGINLESSVVETTHGDFPIDPQQARDFKAAALEAVRTHFDKLIRDALAPPVPAPANVVPSIGGIGWPQMELPLEEAATPNPFAVQVIGEEGGADGDTEHEDVPQVRSPETTDGVREEGEGEGRPAAVVPRVRKRKKD